MAHIPVSVSGKGWVWNQMKLGPNLASPLCFPFFVCKTAVLHFKVFSVMDLTTQLVLNKRQCQRVSGGVGGPVGEGL